MSLTEIKLLLEFEDDSKDEQLMLIESNVTKQLLGKLRRKLPDVSIIPSELDYIITEVSVIRYNRIGSEGMIQESVEGRSATYAANDFAQYAEDIQDYIDSKNEPDTTERRGKAVFY